LKRNAEVEYNLSINDDIRALVVKIEAIIEDETMPEDVGIPSDTRKVVPPFHYKYDIVFDLVLNTQSRMQ